MFYNLSNNLSGTYWQQNSPKIKMKLFLVTFSEFTIVNYETHHLSFTVGIIMSHELAGTLFTENILDIYRINSVDKNLEVIYTEYHNISHLL